MTVRLNWVAAVDFFWQSALRPSCAQFDTPSGPMFLLCKHFLLANVYAQACNKWLHTAPDQVCLATHRHSLCTESEMLELQLNT